MNAAVAGSGSNTPRRERYRDKLKRQARKVFGRSASPAMDKITAASTTVARTTPQHLVVRTAGLLGHVIPARIEEPVAALVVLATTPATGSTAAYTPPTGDETTYTPSTGTGTGNAATGKQAINRDPAGIPVIGHPTRTSSHPPRYALGVPKFLNISNPLVIGTRGRQPSQN